MTTTTTTPETRSPRPDLLERPRLRTALAVALIGLGLFLIAAWLPQFLTWPLGSDEDEFATMAHGWATGEVLPYRDFICFNMPGQIYLFYAVGALFGWESTAGFYGANAALLIALGAAVLFWSVGRPGGLLAGAIGALAVAAYYTNLAYDLAGEREWQATVAAGLALLTADRWPGRPGRVISGLFLAAGAVVRPQVVLFAPVIALLLDANLRRPGRPLRDAVGPVVEWGVAFAVGVAIGFAPVARAGLLDDLVRNLSVLKRGGQYNRTGPAAVVGYLLKQVLTPKVLVALAATAVLVRTTADRALRRRAIGWAAALAVAALYPLVSPTQFFYYEIPKNVLAALDLAVLAQLVAATEVRPAAIRAVLIALLVGVAMPQKPRFVNVGRSYHVLRHYAATGRLPRVDYGYTNVPENPSDWPGYYRWADYQAALDYIRAETAPGTRIANALWRTPAVTGPTARLSAFRTCSFAYLKTVADTEGVYLDALDRAGDSVAIWAPDEECWAPGTPTAPIGASIRARYRPEAKFGEIEIWRRRAPGDAPASGR